MIFRPVNPLYKTWNKQILKYRLKIIKQVQRIYVHILYMPFLYKLKQTKIIYAIKGVITLGLGYEGSDWTGHKTASGRKEFWSFSFQDLGASHTFHFVKIYQPEHLWFMYIFELCGILQWKIYFFKNEITHVQKKGILNKLPCKSKHTSFPLRW